MSENEEQIQTVLDEILKLDLEKQPAAFADLHEQMDRELNFAEDQQSQ